MGTFAGFDFPGLLAAVLKDPEEAGIVLGFVWLSSVCLRVACLLSTHLQTHCSPGLWPRSIGEGIYQACFGLMAGLSTGGAIVGYAILLLAACDCKSPVEMAGIAVCIGLTLFFNKSLMVRWLLRKAGT